MSTPGDIASVYRLRRTWTRKDVGWGLAFLRVSAVEVVVVVVVVLLLFSKFTRIYLHDTLNRSVYIWMFYIPHSLPQMSPRGGEERGARPRAPSVVVLSVCSDLPALFPVCELDTAGSLTSVKPTTTVSVCSLALLQRQAQIRFIARSILLPDFNFAWTKKKQQTNIDFKRWIMNHGDDLWISVLDGKQTKGGRTGRQPFITLLCLPSTCKCCLFLYLDIVWFLWLFIWVTWVILDQKEMKSRSLCECLLRKKKKL